MVRLLKLLFIPINYVINHLTEIICIFVVEIKYVVIWQNKLLKGLHRKH